MDLGKSCGRGRLCDESSQYIQAVPENSRRAVIGAVKKVLLDLALSIQSLKMPLD